MNQPFSVSLHSSSTSTFDLWIMILCFLRTPSYKSCVDWEFLLKHTSGKVCALFISAAAKFWEELSRWFTCDVSCSQGYSTPFLYLDAFSVHLLNVRRGSGLGLKNPKPQTLALWFGKLVIEQESIWSKTLPCHVSLTGAHGKAWIGHSFPKPIFSASHSKDFLKRRWLFPMVFNRGIYPLCVCLIHFFDHICNFGLSSFLWQWVPSCNKSMQASPHVDFMRDSQLMYDLCFGNLRKHSLWRCGSVLDRKKRELSTNRILSFFTCWFHCFCPNLYYIIPDFVTCYRIPLVGFFQAERSMSITSVPLHLLILYPFEMGAQNYTAHGLCVLWAVAQWCWPLRTFFLSQS